MNLEIRQTNERWHIKYHKIFCQSKIWIITLWKSWKTEYLIWTYLRFYSWIEFICLIWKFFLSGQYYRVAMLPTLYPTVSGNMMASLKTIGQFLHAQINYIRPFLYKRTYFAFKIESLWLKHMCKYW